MSEPAEKQDQPTTYSTYDALPPLPLPSLEDTCARYLASVRPLVDDAGYKAAEDAVAALQAPGSLGRRLDDALRKKAETADNWMADWWDDYAYLAVSEPVLINSNFGISCDARTPSDDPATRAAEVACRTIDFYVDLVNETVPPETVGRAATPLDMTFYKRVLGSTRTPGRFKDEIVVQSPNVARHLVVLRRNRIYTVPVLNDSGRAVTVAALARQFQAILDDADAKPDAAPIAALTTERRPVWALERERLLASPTNSAALERIETAIFGVFFDVDAADTFNAVARSGIVGTPGMRWMDKVYNYVVDGRGRVSQHGEHSPADGMQFVTIFDHGCDKAEHGVFRQRPEEQEAGASLAAPAEVVFDLSPESVAAIDAAVSHFGAKVGNLDIEVLHFDAFGKDLIKTFGTGPDPVVQMGYQMAFTRLHGRTPKTYESAQTRMFKLGRTETIRSASAEAAAFVAIMNDPAANTEAKRDAAKAAFEKHGQLGKDASSGLGCDRHLQGLGLMARDLGEETPDILTQEVWTRGWELSTAQLPMNALLVNGFGPVTHAGYGIGYVIQKGTITCHISSNRSHPETSSRRFAQALTEALNEIRALYEA